jgi:hypothetical protein
MIWLALGGVVAFVLAIRMGDTSLDPVGLGLQIILFFGGIACVLGAAVLGIVSLLT